MSPHRTDARLNREKILRVAEEAYAQGSEIVPLAEIARRARLGRATVYRHFPDQRSLGLAVAAQQLKLLRRTVHHAGGGSFRELLGAVLATQIARRPLVRFFRELPVRYQRQYSDSLVTLLTPEFLQAQSRGELRADVQPSDLLVVFEMVEAAVASAHHEDATQRIVAVILDGFFPCSR
ncbi:TetR/AcrR family transcriptional regulator [Amycolatopsis acidicola]|uniref:TetR/AcrR family transcriptional regulator n=1 Tax=Amycolatopsis acidicola TaxID=2596893 RepID=A0A5N0UUY3_9PSEU|nr:TetR/AcrR family transcriptional regulator [Amycolatopsis acidicola]KAA9155386.1 TetR/AcrR family transcriptional regulator [Amycolatopsis acidicola]